jgi:tripartite-type tricarboxylate transporter receptor subunit TctC
MRRGERMTDEYGGSMGHPRTGAAALALTCTVFAAGSLYAQQYPDKPVHVVTTGVGGSSDFIGRLLAQELTGVFGQPVIIDNRANAIIMGELVMRAPPDGYTLLITGASFWIGPLLQKLSYDPIKDFTPISLTATAPTVLVVHPSLPVKSVKDLIALAKAHPGELNYASPGTGSAAHIATELFKSMAHVNLVRVPYKGAAPAVNALLSGEVQVAFSTAAEAMPQVKAGRLRAIAVCSEKPSAITPGLPTVASSGLPGYQAGNINGVFGPAKLPDAITRRLNQEITRVISRPDVKEKLLNAGFEPVGGSPEEFAAVLKSEIAGGAKVIQAAGIKVE